MGMIMNDSETPIYCSNKAVCKFYFSLRQNYFNPSYTKVSVFYYLDKQLPTLNCVVIYMNILSHRGFCAANIFSTQS